MRSAKDLIGKPIISLTDGKQVGTVKDLFLDQELNNVTGIFLGQEGLIGRKTIFIPRNSIAVFGIDAVLATTSDVVTDSKQDDSAEQWLRRDEVIGRQIDTSGGTKVATVGDVLLDEDARVSGFALAKVMVEGPIASLKMITKSVILDVGREDGAMTIDLARAEQGEQEPGDLRLTIDD